MVLWPITTIVPSSWISFNASSNCSRVIAWGKKENDKKLFRKTLTKNHAENSGIPLWNTLCKFIGDPKKSMDQHMNDKRKTKNNGNTFKRSKKRCKKNVKFNHLHSDQCGSSLFRYIWFYFFAYVLGCVRRSTAVHFVYLKTTMIVVVFAKRNKTEYKIFRSSLQHIWNKHKLQNGACIGTWKKEKNKPNLNMLPNGMASVCVCAWKW